MNSSFAAQLAPLHLLKHPFYESWMKGELSLAQIQTYAVQYLPHVEAFPRYVSAVHSRCLNSEIRKALAHNMADEEGLLGSTDHPELWLRFIEGMGVTRSTALSETLKPAAQKLCDEFARLSQSSYAEGLGALYAYEYQIPEIAKSKIEGLKANYAITDERTLEFFAVHELADVYHSEACQKALDLLSPEEQKIALDAAAHAAQLLWDFLTEAYADAAA